MTKHPTTIINAQKINQHYWKNLWRYRDLFLFLAWRDIAVRYKQTSLGIAWVILRPLLMMIVFTIIFSKVAKLPSGNVPYPLLVFTGMLPWQFFASNFSDNSNSIINNRGMISKVYFPRMIIPMSTIIVNLTDFLVSCILLFILICWYGAFPNWRILTLPVFVTTLIILSTGMSLWISTLMVKYRDIRFIVPFTLQFGLYLSPVGFNLSVIPTQWQWLYCLNPMVGIIEGFRWAITPNYQSFNLYSIIASIVVSLLLIVTGTAYFKKTESTFADTV